MIIYRMNIVPYKVAILSRKNVFYYKTKSLSKYMWNSCILRGLRQACMKISLIEGMKKKGKKKKKLIRST